MLYSILIIEDDKMLNEGIAFNLEMDGFKVISAFSLGEARIKLSNDKVDMIILDVNLPDGNGFEFCREIRKEYEKPIIFLTACDMETDIITGFKIGGDDYITKPFSISILRERVLAIFRRYGLNRTINIFRSGEFEFDFEKMTVQKNNKNIFLAPTEYKILKKLVTAKGDILTRQELMDEIWQEDEYIEEHALTVNINRIRRKIEEDPSKPKYIKTVYGIGYSWEGEQN